MSITLNGVKLSQEYHKSPCLEQLPLFGIYINDIDSAATSITMINKFADDTKVGQKTTTVEERHFAEKFG